MFAYMIVIHVISLDKKEVFKMVRRAINKIGKRTRDRCARFRYLSVTNARRDKEIR